MQQKTLIFVALLIFPFFTNAEVSCSALRQKFSDYDTSNIRKSVDLKIPNGVLRKGEHEACAVIEYSVSGNLKPYNPVVIYYYPRPGVARAALIDIGRYEFFHAEKRRVKAFLYFNQLSIIPY